MRSRFSLVRSAVLLAATVAILLGAPPAFAGASASVRFVHAVPGVGQAKLTVGSTALEAGFGTASRYRSAPAGRVTMILSAGGKRQASASERLSDGAHYTVVALGTTRKVTLRLFSDASAKGGVARLRLIHAAPELGAVDVWSGHRKISSDLVFGHSSAYRSLPPGSYPMSVVRPSDGHATLVPPRTMTLTAGTASTAVVVGSAGEPLRLVAMSDTTATPPGAPITGLGGLARPGGGVPWAIVLASALGAAALGGAGYRAAVGPRGAPPARRGD